MRVLHVIDSLDITRGGLPGALELILQMEKKNSISHEVLTLKSDAGVPVKDIGLSGEKIHFFSRSFPGRFSNSTEAIKWLDKNGRKFDLIVVHAIWYILAVRTAKWARKNNVKYVVWPHGSLIPFDLRKKRLLKLILGPLMVRRFLQYAQAVICTGVAERDSLVTFGGTPNVEILPLPVEVSIVAGDKALKHENFFQQINDQDFVFLFMARISFVKRLDLLIDALFEVIQINPSAKLVVAGEYASEPYEKKIKERIEKLAIQNAVIHTGWVGNDAKRKLFERADCFVLPSMGENFGIVVIEALQYGVPVIISSKVATSEDISSAGAGLVCDTTVESVQDKMRQVIEDIRLRNLLRSNAKRAAEIFSHSNLVGKYKEVYSRLQERRK